MFFSKDLKNMIVPLFLEQLLLMLVGIVDTFHIAYCGEAAVFTICDIGLIDGRIID